MKPWSFFRQCPRSLGVILAVFQISLVTAPGHAQVPACTVTFLLEDAVSLGALQFHVDYSGSGDGIGGTGEGAACTNPTPSGNWLLARNDDEAAQTLRLSALCGNGIAGPVAVASCALTGTTAPAPEGFVVTMDDSFPVSGTTSAGSQVCGAPFTGSSPPYARDGLTIIRGAVGSGDCPLCECDVNNSQMVTSTDALVVMKATVGIALVLDCPACDDPPMVTGASADVTVTVTVGCCGNGVIDGVEACDDGNTAAGDCCASDCTFAGDPACEGGAGSLLLLSDSTRDSSDSITWKLIGGPLIMQDDLGDPVSTTAYTLCVMDSLDGVDSLAARLTIGPGTSWIDNGPEGLLYKDRAGSMDGVTMARIKTGVAGKSKILLRAKGGSIPMPEPAATDKFFAQIPKVTVQLHNNATSKCWFAEYRDAKVNSAAKFKSTTP